MKCLCIIKDYIEPGCPVHGNPTSQLDIQIDGEHYKDFAIQPAVFSYKNKFNWLQGEIIKYISRYNLKHGVQDLEKARHLIDMLIEFESEDVEK